MKKEPVIFDKISHSYGINEVLHNINLIIESDIMTVIIGKMMATSMTLNSIINCPKFYGHEN